MAVEQAVAAALASAGAERWISTVVSETGKDSYRQARRGRPGANTTYVKTTSIRYSLAYMVRNVTVAHDAASDGCFPLITNDTAMTAAELLAAYKYQPRLECRHGLLKGVLLVAPVLLKSPLRIEALGFCFYVALLVHALIERDIRIAMAGAGITELSLYPEDRACHAPTAARVLQIFAGLTRSRLTCRGRVVKIFNPTLSPLQLCVLGLLQISPEAYATASGCPS